MNRILTIALNTVREALRDRLMYNLVVFAIILIASSLTISQLTLGEQRRIVTDIGASATQVFGALIAVFVGVSLVSKELDRRTCYPMLARPVARGEFVLGKYVGLLLVLALNVAAMAGAMAVSLVVYAGPEGAALGGAYAAVFGLMLVQLAVCAAFAVLFSSFTTATLATIFTLSLVSAGYVFGEVRSFWLRSKEVSMKPAVRLLDVVLPNMQLLDLKEVLVYGDPLDGRMLLLRVAYGAGYAAVLLVLATFVFGARDVR